MVAIPALFCYVGLSMWSDGPMMRGIGLLLVAMALFSFWEGLRRRLRALVAGGQSSSPLGNRRLVQEHSLGWRKLVRRFLKDAQRFESRQNGPVAFAPFESYWPTYEAMSSQQLAWYFYWRGQFREGHLIDTSLSYLFVHIYELINQIGVNDAEHGYRELMRLWLGYRLTFPELDDYLTPWIADYLSVNRLPHDPLELYGYPDQTFDYVRKHADILLTLHLRQRDDRQLSLPLIDALTDHRIERSSFYEGENIELLARVLPVVIDKVDSQWRAAGAGIFERYRPPHSVPISRPLFQSALYGGDLTATVTIANLYPYAAYQPLRDFLTPLVKYTENLLRKEKGVRGRLRVDPLDEALQRLIDVTVLGSRAAVDVSIRGASERGHGLPIPPRGLLHPPPRIEIDFTRIEQLKAESSDLFDLLALPTESGPVPPLVAKPLAEPSTPPRHDEEPQRRPSANAAPPQRPQRPLKDQPGEEGELPPAPAGVDQRATAPPLAALSASATPQDEWTVLIAALRPPHHQLLAALLAGEGTAVALQQIAMAHATMPALLIDQVNELAQALVGDIVIESDGDQSDVIDDYREQIVTALQSVESE